MRWNITCTAAIGATLALGQSLAHAQQGETTETDTVLVYNPVIVTAQQVEQVSTEVPISITAFDASDIEKQNLTEFERIAALTPGLIVQQQTDSSASFVIRGIEAAGTGAAAEPTISIFLNGIDSSRSRGALKELFDIERVEVVKGPQGTLFGRGASTGAISIISQKADTSENEGYVEAQLGNYDLYSLTGAYNAVLVEDQLALRVAGRRRERSGYMTNIADNRDINDDDLWAARASLRWTPTADLTADLIVDHQRDNDYGVTTKAIGIASPGGDTSPFSQASQNPKTVPQVREQTGVTLLVDWFVNEDWTLSSLSGFRRVWFDNSFDVDGTTFEFSDAVELDRQEATSQEFRFTYDGGGTLRSVFGASYYKDEARSGIDFRVNEQLLFAGFPASTTPVPVFPVAPGVNLPVTEGVVSSSTTANERDSYSVFANVSYDLTERLTLDVGARYTWDEATVTGTADVSTIDGVNPIAFGNGFFGRDLGTSASATGDYELFSPRAALTYALTDELNVYAGVSRGVRSGFPGVSFSNPSPTEVVVTRSDLDNEEVLSFEVGAKGVIAETYLEAALFTYDYTNFQTLSIDFTEGQVNAGEASATGLELVASRDLADWLGVFVSYGYLDTQYDEFRETLNGEVVDLSGNTFRLAPEHTFAIGLDARHGLHSGWELFGNANYSYRADYFFNNDNLSTEQQEAFGLLDLRAGIESPDGKYRFEIYGENVLDEEWNRDIGNAGKLFGVPTAIRANPAFYGARLRVNFN